MNKKQNSLMRFSRTERLAQLSEQEIVIERKKREIQAKLEAQKKKQTEETLKKLETSRETKKPGFSKKSWSGVEHHKNTSKEKSVEQVKEGLTNAFSNDGSFLDQFKKLSQTGLSANPVDMKISGTTAGPKKIQDIFDEDLGSEANEKVGSSTARKINESKLPSLVQNQLDSRVQFQILPPGLVHLQPQHQSVSTPSTNDNPVSSHSINPQFQGGMQNPVNAFSSQNTFLNSSQSNLSGNAVQFPQSGSVFNSAEKDGSLSSKFSHDKFSMTTMPCSQPHQPSVPIMPQNIPPPTSIQVQNILPPPVASSELPKLRSESISMTLKSNMVKKLEAIPNPLEVDQPPSPSPSSPKSSKGFLNTSSIVENVSSQDRESSRISSAFFNNDEDGEEDDLSDEKYHQWARLVARCGDSFEDSLQNRNQSDPDIQFLLNKNSKEYLSFRKLVSMYRRQLRSSGEPSEKILKLNSSDSHEKPIKELISSDEGKYCKEKSSDEENSDSNEPLGPERNASFGRQENQKHSRHYETREDYPHQYKASALTSKEDCLLSSSKLSKEVLKENPKDRKTLEHFKNEERPKRKRKSRWGDAVPTTSTPGIATNLSLQPAGKLPAPKSTLLSQLTRSDPGLIQYARQTFGSTNLSEEDWKKAEDHYKINLLYQDMVKKRAEVEKLEKQGKFKYEYDSDEDTEGGTWEHKLRQQEMQATQLWAEELTRQAAGKHHIGDFLPPEELERFMEKYNAVKEGREPDLSDYKEYKLKEDNVGYRLLQKMGWNEGQGLGQDGSGITNPVNKATTRHENQGLGVERPDGLEPGDDEYDAYRKRMMLAYRFRPNPLNNPRRPYY